MKNQFVGQTKIGFTGTREGMSEYQIQEVICWLREIQPSEVHHGLCEGSDGEFHDLVVEGINAFEGIVSICKIIGHPPLAKKFYAYRKCDEFRPDKPYLVRDHNIVDETDTLIACPLGDEVMRSGTWATIRYALKQKKEVILIPRNYDHIIKRLNGEVWE